MLSFNTIMEVFADYLTEEPQHEVFKVKYGYMIILWDTGGVDYSTKLCDTLEELVEELVGDVGLSEIFKRTRGKRETTDDDEQAAKAIADIYRKKCGLTV